MATEQKRLTGLYRDVTDCIPVLLEDQEGIPLREIYAPLLMEEDLDAMKRTRRPDEPSGSKTLDSVRNVFYVRDREVGEKLSTRILVKGEAGSGKSVFCLKLVECWSQIKQFSKLGHMCEKPSELIRQLEGYDELPRSLWQLHYTKIPCTTCEMRQYLSQFDLLYYVPLRDATEGKTSVVDMVCDALCKKRQSVIDRTKRLLDNDNICCLIVMDGVDEWPNPSEFNGLPNSDGLSDNCVLLWTMRPWKLEHLQLKPKHDDHIVTISGLTPNSVKKVIENILIRFYGLKGDALKSRFLAYCKKVTDKTLAGIMRMPIMLIAACHLWQREEAFGSNESLGSEKSFSKTHLYLSLLDLMIQNAARKQNKQRSVEQNLPVSLLSNRENIPSTHPDLPEILKTFDHVSHFIDMLLPFCELAHTDLISGETKLVFHKGQLERQLGKSRVDLVHRLGLISQAKVQSDIGSPQNVSVSFYHKSVQELLAAMYMTCGHLDAVTSFCDYCSTLEKVWETANVTMFVVGLDPSLGCSICEHIAKTVNIDPDITEYRRTLYDDPRDRVRRTLYDDPRDMVRRTLGYGHTRIEQLYNTQCEWYRELTHVQTVTGDKSPPPSLHVTDIYLDGWSDSDTVRLTEDLMSANLGTIVSVGLWGVHRPLHRVAQYLPQCPHLSALCIDMSNKEDRDLLVSVIHRLTQLTTVRYNGLASIADCAVVPAVMSLTQLVRVELEFVRLGGDGLNVTDTMTRLRTVVLHMVRMTARRWGRFVSRLLTLPQSVYVTLRTTDIDKGTVRRVQTSPRITVTKDDRERDGGWYKMLEFTTIPSQTT